MGNEAREQGAGGLAPCVAAGVGTVFGWLLHDLAVFWRFGTPRTPLALVPGAVVALGVGALLGLTLLRRKSLLLLAGLLAVLAVLPLVTHPALSRAVLWVPRAALLLLLATFLTVRLAERAARSSSVSVTRYFLLGALLGVLACGLKSSYRHTPGALPAELLFGSGIALLLATATRLRLLGLTCLLGLGAPMLLLLSRAREHDRIRRPDLAAPTTRPEGASPPNLILIVLDTLRADRLAPYGYRRATTPALDRFVAARMTRFTNVHAVSPWTLPSHASLLTGRLPADHGATHPRGSQHGTRGATLRPAVPLAPDAETLAERLRALGYRTGAFLANCAYLDARFGLDQGFERYDARPPTHVGQYLALPQLGGLWPEVGHVPYRSATQITSAAEEWMASVEGAGAPFFLLLNLMEAHEPYVLPRALQHAFEDEGPVDPLKATELDWAVLYDRALLHLDAQLAPFLEELDDRGILENTVLVITADHGQALGEHEFHGHAWALTEEQLRVPLYVLPKGGRTAELDDRPLDLASLHALVLEFLGLDATVTLRPFRGPVSELYRATAPPGIRRWAQSIGRNLNADRLAWLDGQTKWIVSSDETVQAFDLGTDPGELHPLPTSESERETALDRARSWWSAHPPRTDASGPLSEELEDRMNALGYGGR